jgi:sialate O-acetylesterase
MIRFRNSLLLNFSLGFVLILGSVELSANITLPYFFSDNMVIQQKTDAAIWGWAKPNSSVQVTGSWNKKRYTVKSDAEGKWKLKIATPAAGGPYEITISDGNPLTLHNVLVGEVWMCSGQSNMDMPMKGFRDQPILGSNEAIFHSSNDNIRLYTVPRSVQVRAQDSSKKSSWKIAGPEAVSNFSATAYYFGRILQQQLKVPVGLINISYGGSPAEAFMSAEALKVYPELKLPGQGDSAKATNRTPTALYNGMLRPFIGYNIKGCLWYQGEANNGRPDQYEKLMASMVAQWRKEFGQGNFPFYFVQIAPYKYAQGTSSANPKINSAYLRDAQRKSLQQIPESGMVVLTDVGEENSIHPANKETVGQRLAYLALGKTYGLKGFAYSSPSYDSLLVDGNIATIIFKDAPNGLTSFGKPIVNFEIAGADKVFKPAKAVILRGAVLVSSPEVPAPVAVRYAFRDFVVGELFGTEGLPVSSFRTDDW